MIQDDIEEFNMDWEWSAQSSAGNQKQNSIRKEGKRWQKTPVSSKFKSKLREGSPDGTWNTMEQKICERDEFLVWIERSREW